MITGSSKSQMAKMALIWWDIEDGRISKTSQEEHLQSLTPHTHTHPRGAPTEVETSSGVLQQVLEEYKDIKEERTLVQ